MIIFLAKDGVIC